jgi:hypothetical protein
MANMGVVRCAQYGVICKMAENICSGHSKKKKLAKGIQKE